MEKTNSIDERRNAKFEKLINESMNVSVNLSNGPDGRPTKSISINATDEDADQLARILNLAGLDGGDHQPEIAVVAEPDVEVVDEAGQMPDWPTNPETMSDTPTLSTYSGGLNKPKVTGQTTGAPVNVSPRRGSFNEDVTLERSLFKLYQDYKGGE